MPEFHALHAPSPFSTTDVPWWPGGPIRPVVPAHRGGGELELAAWQQQQIAPQPPEPRGLLGWRIRRACRREGGHWWHPVDAWLALYCCNCGATKDGLPSA